jgi:hypothetical protein
MSRGLSPPVGTFTPPRRIIATNLLLSLNKKTVSGTLTNYFSWLLIDPNINRGERVTFTIAVDFQRYRFWQDILKQKHLQYRFHLSDVKRWINLNKIIVLFFSSNNCIQDHRRFVDKSFFI